MGEMQASAARSGSRTCLWGGGGVGLVWQSLGFYF
uniref:Uncharacterized protein n=1 Tax=Anguilla anguilla TaxID=7936 RepID=A0A0E9PPB9_ANGAN